jgi:hypothetical protein
MTEYGLGPAGFGDAPAGTIAVVTAALGPPDHDSGWIDAFSPYGTCPPPEVRGVEWGTSPSGYGAGLLLLFSNGETGWASAGTEHFLSYVYAGGNPAGLVTDRGIGIGSTLAEVRAAYPGVVVAEDPFDPSAGTWRVDSNPADDGQLFGYATGQADGDVVTGIVGGIGCGE